MFRSIVTIVDMFILACAMLSIYDEKYIDRRNIFSFFVILFSYISSMYLMWN